MARRVLMAVAEVLALLASLAVVVAFGAIGTAVLLWVLTGWARP